MSADKGQTFLRSAGDGSSDLVDPLYSANARSSLSSGVDGIVGSDTSNLSGNAIGYGILTGTGRANPKKVPTATPHTRIALNAAPGGPTSGSLPLSQPALAGNVVSAQS